MIGAVPRCQKCGRSGWHYVPPRLGEPGYYVCPEQDPPPPDPHQLEAFPASPSPGDPT